MLNVNNYIIAYANRLEDDPNISSWYVQIVHC